MTAVRAVGVVVPAHDEQDLVLRCLDAIAEARRHLAAVRPEVATSVTVVLDTCGDDTARLVASRPDTVALVVAVRCVGAARGAGTRAAVGRFAVPPEAVWTAHTDADSVVPPQWLTAMVTAADSGIDAVLGLVTPDDRISPSTHSAWSALNPPCDDHPYVHGANLGVRAVALAAAGGWAALPTGEDVELAARLRATPGVVVRSLAAHPVVTSSRAVARAPEGFSSYLRELTVA